MMIKAIYFGFNPPFFTGTTVMPVQTNERLIKNDLLQLLLTVPGERVFRPTFGTNVRPTLFDQIDQTTVSDLRESIITAITAFEPRVKVIDVVVETLPDANMLSVKIFAAFVANAAPFELDLSLPIGKSVTGVQPQQRV